MSPVVELDLDRHRRGVAELDERWRAFDAIDRTGAPTSWPPVLPDPFPGTSGPPEVTPGEIDAAVLGGGILNHGSVIVRGLVPADEARSMVEVIDAAFDAHDRWAASDGEADTAPLFTPFRPTRPCPIDRVRTMVRRYGALFAAEVPTLASSVLAHYESAGIRDALAGYFGERPAVSVDKFTLRRVEPDAYPSWHQDGSFMGAEIRSVNVWVTLTDCGGDAPVPGLDIVDHRIPQLLETGTQGALMDSAIGRPVVDAAAGSTTIVRPAFRAGDALVFDDRLPHATGTSPGMTGARYAVESWFFSPSWFPSGYVPLAF